MPLDPEFEGAIRRFMTEHVRFNSFLGIQIRDLDHGFARMAIPFREELMGDPLRPALHGCDQCVDGRSGRNCLAHPARPGRTPEHCGFASGLSPTRGKSGTPRRGGGSPGRGTSRRCSHPDLQRPGADSRCGRDGVYQIKRKDGASSSSQLA